MVILSPDPTEVARFKGAGIVVEVRSDDRGAIGNHSRPARAKVLDVSGCRRLAEIIITRAPPQKPADVFYYRTENVPDGLSRAIVKFAGMSNQKYKRAGLNLTNWQAIIAQWFVFHGE